MARGFTRIKRMNADFFFAMRRGEWNVEHGLGGFPQIKSIIMHYDYELK